jgi:hypothetical protein
MYHKLYHAVEESQWVYRVWTVQEFVLGSRVSVICGQRQLSWECFAGFITTSGVYVPREYRKWKATMNVLKRMFLKDYSKSRNATDYTETILSILRDVRILRLHSSEPRDQVYGFLAMLRPFGLNINADYTKTVAQVYADMTFAFIMKGVSTYYIDT